MAWAKCDGVMSHVAFAISRCRRGVKTTRLSRVCPCVSRSIGRKDLKRPSDICLFIMQTEEPII